MGNITELNGVIAFKWILWFIRSFVTVFFYSLWNNAEIPDGIWGLGLNMFQLNSPIGKSGFNSYFKKITVLFKQQKVNSS